MPTYPNQGFGAGYSFYPGTNDSFRLTNAGGALTDFLQFLKGHVQDEIGGIPKILMEKYIRDIVKDFCTSTEVWKETYIFDAIPNESCYVLKPSDDKSVLINSLMSTSIFTSRTAEVLDGTTITTPEDLDSDLVTERVLQPGRDFKTAQKEDWQMVLRPPVSEFQYKGIEVTCSVRPTLTGSHIPRRVLDDWYYYLACGIKSRLMLMGSKSWSDPQLGMYYKKEYNSGITKNRIELNKNATSNNTLKMTIPIGYRF